MKVGDLIRDKRWPEDGWAIITEIKDRRKKNPYRLYCFDNGEDNWFEKDYVEQECEVINESPN